MARHCENAKHLKGNGMHGLLMRRDDNCVVGRSRCDYFSCRELGCEIGGLGTGYWTAGEQR